MSGQWEYALAAFPGPTALKSTTSNAFPAYIMQAPEPKHGSSGKTQMKLRRFIRVCAKTLHNEATSHGRPKLPDFQNQFDSLKRILEIDAVEQVCGQSSLAMFQMGKQQDHARD